jgi:microsomal dipeptidase-like Zn-dependent dipeptidase/GMP synthase-like glutamine amidotransferase
MAEAFDLEGYLREIYARYPEGNEKPVIGITGNYGELTCKLAEGYYKSVVAAGGVPLIIPPIADKDAVLNTLSHIDGLILSGGGDYDPHWVGEEPSPLLGTINAERDLPELLITRLAYNRQIPILGICRGIQTLAMALGGHVAQDISAGATLQHSQEAPREEATHSVTIKKDSLLYAAYQAAELRVNSFHHQAVDDPGHKFRTIATSPDGIIEAMESTEYKPILGVQWHPECLRDGLPIFQWLMAEAAAYRKACRTHDRVLTLDTHCDTPMFFPQDIHFDHRDPKILVDLHKMTEGHQDATIMVAYLPQTMSEGPRAYADAIFDKIEAIVAQNSDYIRIARTPDDLWMHKHQGVKSIMLGIENGLAIEGRLENLQHFKDRGIVYMTLCHNGDNDICDSAKGCNTHGGVSAFGEQVIREMNRLGILVDMSHAGEKSFYDALDISTVPIVCSHSSARALCDHPRNLTDDQMRALAAKGGVAQTTIYNGFLRTDGKATILDVMAHLEHAIDVMGIDHVGLGTDFDGDGGVRGLADSSELLNFTRQLLARRFSEQDIQKIWGGNFLRVMRQALLFLLLFLVTSCGLRQAQASQGEGTSADPELVEGSSGEVPVFSADSAYAFCQAQCDFGPRTMNSKAHDDCLRWLATKFSDYGLTITEQHATLKGYDGTPLRSTNLIASYRPEAKDRILLCAHWDSRPWADNDPDPANHHTPVLAANDGASGVAVMLEIARTLRQAQGPSDECSLSLSKGLSKGLGVDFVCFDAEDWGVPQWSDASYDGDSWALGAQYWAAHLPKEQAKTYRYGILLDMVGGQGARFYQEQMSLYYARGIVDKVWRAAQVVGFGSLFPTQEGGGITDDHIPVNRVAKIPCIDIIPYYPDCEQSSFGPTWHTIHDDMDHIDRTTLQAVGQTLLQVLYSE